MNRGRRVVQEGGAVPLGELQAWAVEVAENLTRRSLATAINLSGVVLHTGLGRARLCREAADHIAEIAASHSLTEFDRATGKRGDRMGHVRSMLLKLTNAEDALVVNNCAGAVFLTLNALCAGRKVVLSRGEMVEIGGSFRLPDIVRESGCHLVEVGCTNRTRLSDFERALDDGTAAVLRCHPSNFRIVGFHEEANPRELADLCKSRGVLFLDDLGSGCLIDTTKFGLPKERTLQEALADGADVVTSSGDKLLGATQAGLVLGKREIVQQIARHPLARALRVDKLTLAGLESTLRLYTEGRAEEIPVWRYLSRPLPKVKKLAQQLARASSLPASVHPGLTEVGGGSMPGTTVPTWRVRLTGANPDMILAALRGSRPPLIGYIEDGSAWLDPRTLEDDECKAVLSALKGLADNLSSGKPLQGEK